MEMILNIPPLARTIIAVIVSAAVLFVAIAVPGKSGPSELTARGQLGGDLAADAHGGQAGGHAPAGRGNPSADPAAYPLLGTGQEGASGPTAADAAADQARGTQPSDTPTTSTSEGQAGEPKVEEFQIQEPPSQEPRARESQTEEAQTEEAQTEEAQTDQPPAEGPYLPPPPLPTFPADVWSPEQIVIGELEPGPGPQVPLGPSDLKTLPKVYDPGVLGSNDIKHGAGCAVSCITSGTAHAVGVGAELTVTTDTPAKIWIMVWNETSHFSAFAGHDLRTSFSYHFEDLTAGTTYQAVAIAQDAAGGQDERYGEFTTLHRHARVQFGGVNVTSKISANSYDYYFGVDDEWIDGFAVTTWPYPYHHPLGGSKVIEVSDVGDQLPIAVQAVATQSGICEGVHFPTSMSNGEAGCKVWGTAPHYLAPITLDGSVAEYGKPVPRSFTVTLTTPGEGGLGLEAIVLIDVWYA